MSITNKLQNLYARRLFRLSDKFITERVFKVIAQNQISHVDIRLLMFFSFAVHCDPCSVSSPRIVDSTILTSSRSRGIRTAVCKLNSSSIAIRSYQGLNACLYNFHVQSTGGNNFVLEHESLTSCL